MRKRYRIGALTLAVVGVSVLAGLSAQGAQAFSSYASATGKPCGYCHIDPAGGGPLTAAGTYYKQHGTLPPAPTTTTTARPTTTTTRPATTTTTKPTTTTTAAPGTTTTTAAPGTTTTTAPPPPATGAFVDVTSANPNFVAVNGLAREGVVNGYGTGPGRSFRPQNRAWRAQVAKMVAILEGLPVNENMHPAFADLGPDDPATLYPQQYVAAMAAKGWMQGTSSDSFSPWADISRAQLVAIAVRVGKSTGRVVASPAGYKGTFGAIDPAYQQDMRWAEYNGLFKGVTGFGGSWDPWAPAGRAELAQILWNLSQK